MASRKVIPGPRICDNPSCFRPAESHGLCRIHRLHQIKADNISYKLCKIPNCGHAAESMDLCKTHYQQKFRKSRSKVKDGL